jgi:hypothetical protein
VRERITHNQVDYLGNQSQRLYEKFSLISKKPYSISQINVTLYFLLLRRLLITYNVAPVDFRVTSNENGFDFTTTS